MAKSLFEAYKNRLQVAGAVYSKAHNGESMSQNRKLVTAKVLENTNRFLNEAFDNTVGTQRSDMQMYKKFCMNLTTVGLPNLIAHDLVIVHPMSSMSGYVTYISYQFASNKGGVAKGDLIADPFRFGNMGPDSDRVDYTGSRVVEPVTVEGSFAPAWDKVVENAFFVKDNVEVASITDGAVAYTYKVIHADKSVEYVNEVTNVKVGDKVAYIYDNIVVPQAQMPMIKAEMKSIALVAKARRIAIYYSNIAQFQAKTDYGVDLGDQLAEKAVGELNYEIDTEVIDLLSSLAGEALPELMWSKTLPVGVSKSEHYDGFVEIVEIAKQKIYDATQKFAPNYMLIASNILPVLMLCKSFKAAPTGAINGPYYAGQLGSLKVFVTPRFEAGRYVIGCNGGDMMSSAAVYAPYMAVLPTQLLGYSDGGMSQGWSTLYALEPLNKALVIAGKVD